MKSIALIAAGLFIFSSGVAHGQQGRSDIDVLAQSLRNQFGFQVERDGKGGLKLSLSELALRQLDAAGSIFGRRIKVTAGKRPVLQKAYRGLGFEVYDSAGSVEVMLSYEGFEKVARSTRRSARILIDAGGNVRFE